VLTPGANVAAKASLFPVGDPPPRTIADTFSAQERADLVEFLRTIDGATPIFESETEQFLDELVGG
jgi:hypothetical protein